MTMSDWTIVTRSLSARRFTTATTVLTVAVAVCLLLTILTMRNSGKRAFERGSGDMHMLVSAEQSPLVSVLNTIFYANPPRRFLTWARYEQLLKEAPWAYAVPTVQGDSFNGYPVVATTPEFFNKFRPEPGENWKLSQGQPLKDDQDIVLGSLVSSKTGITLGDTIYLTHGTPEAGTERAESAGKPIASKVDGDIDDHGDHGDHASAEDHDADHANHADHAGAAHIHRDFACKVVGVLAPTGGSADRAVFTTIGTNWLMHAHDRRLRENPNVKKTTLADLLDEDKKLTAVLLRLQSPGGSESPASLPMFFDKLRKDPTLMVASPRQEIGNLFKIVDSANRVFLVIAGAVFLSSGVAIMLALYNSMQTRQRQLAVLRVLGASSARILGLALTESVIIGVAGAAVGVAMGLMGAGFAAGIVRERMGVVIEPRFAPEHIGLVTLGAVVLAGVAGIIPAFMAYRVSVSQNLRPAL